MPKTLFHAFKGSHFGRVFRRIILATQQLIYFRTLSDIRPISRGNITGGKGNDRRGLEEGASWPEPILRLRKFSYLLNFEEILVNISSLTSSFEIAKQACIWVDKRIVELHLVVKNVRKHSLECQW